MNFNVNPPGSLTSIPKQPATQAHRAMLVSLTVGKVDAGVAVLLTEDKRLVSTHSLRNRSPYALNHGDGN